MEQSELKIIQGELASIKRADLKNYHLALVADQRCVILAVMLSPCSKRKPKHGIISRKFDSLTARERMPH